MSLRIVHDSKNELLLHLLVQLLEDDKNSVRLVDFKGAEMGDHFFCGLQYLFHDMQWSFFLVKHKKPKNILVRQRMAWKGSYSSVYVI